MDDEDVVFEGSPLHGHLIDAGYGDFKCEKKKSQYSDPKKEHSNPHASAEGGSDTSNNHTNLWSGIKQLCSSYVFDESWQKQVQTLHKRSCDHILDLSVKKQVLYEEDATYVESFASSISISSSSSSSSYSDSLYGQMFLQVAVLFVTIGYGLIRMFYAKSAPLPNPMPSSSSDHVTNSFLSSVLIYGLDILSILVIVAALLPATIKFASVGRLVGRLDSFNDSFTRLVSLTELLRKSSMRSILFIQESEVVKRGYTLVTVPVCRLELGLNSCGERQCLDLRRSVFYRNKAALLEIRKSSLSLLELFPGNVELRGVKSCLARQELNSFCDYLSTDNLDGSDGNDDDHGVFKLTDGYSLSSLKFLVELTGAHESEFARLLFLLCLIETNEISSTKCSAGVKKNEGFMRQTSILSHLFKKVEENYEPLERCLSVLQELRKRIVDGSDERKKRRGGSGGGETGAVVRGMHVAMHSLRLHLESALRRVQENDEKLESILDNCDNDDCGGTDSSARNLGQSGICEGGEAKYDGQLIADLAAEAKQLSREVKASRECLDELETILAKLSKSPKSKEDAKPNAKIGQNIQEEMADIPFISSDSVPVAEDEVFEGMSGLIAKELKAGIEDDETVMETKQKRKDAARVISELRSVISVRARDMEERERKAFMKKVNNYQQGNMQQVEEFSQSAGSASQLQQSSDILQQQDAFNSSESMSQPASDQASSCNNASESKSENAFNGARPKERWDPIRSARTRRDRQYFGDRIESSDSDSDALSGHYSHHVSKSSQLRHRKSSLKSSFHAVHDDDGSSVNPTDQTSVIDLDIPCDIANAGLFGFSVGQAEAGDPLSNGYQGPSTIKSIAHMAASLSKKVNLGEEELFGNDLEDDDDDVIGDDVDDDDEINDADNDVSDSQSGDLDSDDIYHVTDDDEGFDGVNVGYDDDDDDDDDR